MEVKRRLSTSGSLKTRLGIARHSLARLPNHLRRKRKRKSTICGVSPAALLLKVAFEHPAIDRVLVPIDDQFGDEESGTSEEDSAELRELHECVKNLRKCQDLITEQVDQLPRDINRPVRTVDLERFSLLRFTSTEFYEQAKKFVELACSHLEQKREGLAVEEFEVFFDALDIEPQASATHGRKFTADDSNDLPLNAEDRTSEMPARRTRLPERPSNSVNYLALMRNCIGKDLSKIAMPVDFNEPLSALQRLVEELEHTHLLDQAAAETSDPYHRLALVSAFAISGYPPTGQRTTKPFNPLLGETYECDRRKDRGFIAVCEQVPSLPSDVRTFCFSVSHHPISSAVWARGSRWTLETTSSPLTRIKGRSFLLTPSGRTYVRFSDPKDEVISYNKVTTKTTMTNLISGKLQTENVGVVTVQSNQSGAKCVLKFEESGGYFSKDDGRKVSGTVVDAQGRSYYTIEAVWDDHAVIRRLDSRGQPEGHQKMVWAVTPLPKDSAFMHGFSFYAIELNEMEQEVMPTDSRLRIDQRAMEEGNWPLANELKRELEEKQRQRRRIREEREPEYEPIWFKRKSPSAMRDEHDVYEFDEDEYLRCKKAGDWAVCPRIFDL